MKACGDLEGESMHDASARTLERRTDSPKATDLRRLDPNDFWRQARSILEKHLDSTTYGEVFYVPVRSEGKDLADHFVAFASLTGDPRCLLLAGQYGVGKTSALQHFGRTLLPAIDPQAGPFRWIYFDGNTRTRQLTADPGSFDEALQEVANESIRTYLAANGMSDDDFDADIFAHDEIFAVSRRLHRKASVEKKSELVNEKLAQPSYFIEAALRFLARRVVDREIIVVLDNIDQFDISLQATAFTFAQALAASCRVRCIVSIRNSSHFKLRYHHPQVIAPFLRLEVPAPSMTEVIRLRIDQALARPEAQNVVLGEGHYRARVADCPEFTQVLVRGLESPSVARLLQGLSNGSVRDALHFAKDVYSSRFIDATRIIRKLTPAEVIVPSIWRGHLPYHVVLKALLLCNHPIHSSSYSWVPNLFGTRHSETHLGPFLRLHILQFMQEATDEDLELQAIVDVLVPALGAEEALIEKELQWLDSHGCLLKTHTDRWATTIRGRFFVSHLAYDAEYLTHISTDVDLYRMSEENLASPAERPHLRIRNLMILIEYLVDRERILLAHLTKWGVDSYRKVFGVLRIMQSLMGNVRESLDNLRKSGAAKEEEIDSVVAGASSRLTILLRQADHTEAFRIFGTRSGR